MQRTRKLSGEPLYTKVSGDDIGGLTLSAAGDTPMNPSGSHVLRELKPITADDNTLFFVFASKNETLPDSFNGLRKKCFKQSNQMTAC